MNKVYPSSFRLTEEARRLLAMLAKQYGISRGDVLELLIRERAKKEKISRE